MANLYELSAEFTALLDAYEAAETDEEREDILNALLGIQGDINAKATAYAKTIRNVKADVQAYSDEAKRLTKHAQTGKNLIERLEAALLDGMKVTGITEIKTDIGKWRLQTNPLSCEVTDWQKVPMAYRTPQPDKVDKKGLIDRHKATGELIDGVEFKQEQGLRFQ